MTGMVRSRISISTAPLLSGQTGQIVGASQKKSFWSKPVVAALTLLMLFFATFLVDRLLRPGYFTIESIHIEGNQYKIDARTIERLAWRNVNGNYFSVDLHLIEKNLEKIPGVYAVTVRRIWPGALQISITESERLAKWSESQAEKSLPAIEELINLPPGRNLTRIPELSGPAGERETIFQTYMEIDRRLWPLGMEIIAIDLTRSGDWTFSISTSPLDVDARFILIIGRQDPIVKVSDFLEVYEVALRSQADAISAIDLRYPSGMAVRWKTLESETLYEANL